MKPRWWEYLDVALLLLGVLGAAVGLMVWSGIAPVDIFAKGASSVIASALATGVTVQIVKKAVEHSQQRHEADAHQESKHERA
jgi:hypothetical protein